MALWAALGGALAAAGAIDLAPPVAPAFVVGSCALAIAAYRRRGAMRAWADALPIGPLLVLHAVRLAIGARFLSDHAHGRLPGAFAIRGGIGDIAIGALAITVALAPRRRLVVGFSLVGLADILMVFGTAMYLLFVTRDPGMHAALAHVPYALLPLGVVPVIILAHALVLARYYAPRRHHRQAFQLDRRSS